IGVFRFDENIRNASRNQATHAALPVRELPGDPTFLFSGYEALPPKANAHDKLRLLASPSSGDGPLTLAGGRAYATYFGIVMGLEAAHGTLSWVHTHPSPVIGGAAAENGVVLCDEHGGITALDAQTGGQAWDLSFGEPIRSCTVQVDGLALHGDTQ